MRGAIFYRHTGPGTALLSHSAGPRADDPRSERSAGPALPASPGRLSGPLLRRYPVLILPHCRLRSNRSVPAGSSAESPSPPSVCIPIQKPPAFHSKGPADLVQWPHKTARAFFRMGFSGVLVSRSASDRASAAREVAFGSSGRMGILAEKAPAGKAGAFEGQLQAVSEADHSSSGAYSFTSLFR